MVEVELSSPGPQDVLVKVKHSLISCSSECFARSFKEHAVSPQIVGYSNTGTVVKSGAGIAHIHPGDRVMAQGPHAQYVVQPAAPEADGVFVLPKGLGNEAATFLPLVKAGVAWSRAAPTRPGDTVIVLGQRLVGNLYRPAVRERTPRPTHCH